MKEKLSKKQEDALFSEKFDIEFDILDRIDILILCKWDSPTIKHEIEKLCEQREKLSRELFD